MKKAVDATKPKPGIAMSKEGGKLPSIARAEEEKKIQKIEKGRKNAKEKYQVSKIFEDVSGKVVKNKKPPVPVIKKKQREEENIDAQIDQYMRELGLA